MTLYDERLRLAQRIAGRLLDRHGDVIIAIGLHGSMARGPDAVDERSDIDLLVVTDAPDAIGERDVFLDGVFISMSVNTVPRLLDRAGTVSWDWAIVSDQYVNTFVLHDPDGFFDRLREAQEDAVERTAPVHRAESAQGVVMAANEWLTKADRALDGGTHRDVGLRDGGVDRAVVRRGSVRANALAWLPSRGRRCGRGRTRCRRLL